MNEQTSKPRTDSERVKTLEDFARQALNLLPAQTRLSPAAPRRHARGEAGRGTTTRQRAAESGGG